MDSTDKKLLCALAVLLAIPLFLSQCVHTYSMTGGAGFLTLGAPDWYNVAVKRGVDERADARYLAALNALQSAIALDKSEDEIRKLISQHPEQIHTATRRDETAIDIAIRMKNPRAISLLLQAGVSGVFVDKDASSYSTRGKETAMQAALFIDRMGLGQAGMAEPASPIGPEYAHQSLASHQKIKELLIDPFLAARQLDPSSDLAQELLGQAAGITILFNRFLGYGVKPISPNLLDRAILRSNANLIFYLLASKPYQEILTFDDRTQYVETAISICDFRVANLMLQSIQSRKTKKLKLQGQEWLTMLVKKCGSVPSTSERPRPDGWYEALDGFIEQLEVLKVDPNLEYGHSPSCPAWLNGSSLACKPPTDQWLVDRLRKMGASPF
jgi:hypothetical protein